MRWLRGGVMSACISSQGEYSEHEWSPKLICQRCFVYPELPDALRILGDDSDLLWTVARRAIEDELIEWRDNYMFVASRNNGLVIKSRSGEPATSSASAPRSASALLYARWPIT